jgi:hypothetical protein
VSFRPGRWDEVIERQLDVFLQDHADLVRECEEALARYDAADANGAEELYGEYVDLVEEGTEILADMRDRFATTLADEDCEDYGVAFNGAVAKRLPRFALEIDNR